MMKNTHLIVNFGLKCEKKNKWNTTVLFIPKQYCISRKGQIIIAYYSFISLIFKWDKKCEVVTSPLDHPIISIWDESKLFFFQI